MTRDETILAATEMMKWGQSGWADGEEVQYSPKQGKGSAVWTSTDNPLWNWEHYDYRIKPTVKLRPWTPDEVPLGAWVRNTQYPKTRWLIDRTSSEENRKDWLDTKYEHSTDGGKNWLPCGVVEEAK
jgi:hypothetical protein